MAQMPGTEKLEYILQVATMTSRIEHGIPVSIMLVAESGAGKSQTLLRVSAPFIYRVDDLTSQGLFDTLMNDNKNELSFIAIPDFNVVLSHKAQVTQLLIANLLTVTDTGLVAVADGRQRKEIQHRPIGLLSAVTRDMFLSHHKRWQRLGLIRRFLALHFEYSPETIRKAMNSINNGHINVRKPKALPDINVPAVLIPPKFNTEIESLTKDLQVHMGQYVSWERQNDQWLRKVGQGTPILPMSPYKVMRTMARAHALLHERKTINSADVEFLSVLLAYTNMSRPAIV